MSLNFEGGKTWPYPTRSVEFVADWKKEDFEIRPIELNNDELEALKKLDEGLFEELKSIKKKRVEKSEKVDGEIEQRRLLVKEEYLIRKGETNDFPELVRTVREFDEEGLAEKIGEYKVFKSKIKDLLREVDGEDNLSRMSIIVLDMYRRYVNVAISDLYYRKVKTVKNAERMDKFIRGVSTKNDKDGNFLTLDNNLRKEVEILESGSIEKMNYPEVWLDEDDIELVANVLLKKLGVEEWKVVRRSSDKSTFGIYKPKKEIRIGKNMRRKVEEVLPVIAHEIEGHVIHAEKEVLGGYMPKIMRNYSAGGRDSVLGEMMGRWVEDETRKLMGIEPKKPETLYFRTLEKKRDGATFVECFDYYFREYVKRAGDKLDEVWGDREKYEMIFDQVYDRVMRLFRKNSSLEDKSGYLPTTDQLKYLEQYLVLKRLIELDMEELMFLDGADLYSAKQIKELGLLDVVGQFKPRFALANEIWPVIKIGLDGGKEIKEVLAEMKIE